MLNKLFPLLTEEEQLELIQAGLACCGAFDSEWCKCNEPKTEVTDD